MGPLAAWCPKGAQLATAAEYHAPVIADDGRRVLGWRCPACGRVVRIGQSRSTNSDRRGWQGTLGQRWPRHYAWAKGMSNSSGKD